MSRSVWAVLGVPANSDRAVIRRAYAAKLKQTNPEDDPEGFKTLRGAYDQALAMADARAHAAEHGDVDDWFDEDEYDDSVREAVFTAAQPDRRLGEPPAAAGVPDACDTGLLDGRAGDLAEFEQRMNALAQQLTSPWGQDETVLEAALHHILAAPAMAEIGVRAHAEEWIAGLLASNIPQSDALLLQAIEAFGWDGASGQRGQLPAVAAILHRIDEWRTIQALTSRGDQYHFAFNELARAPRAPWRMRLQALNPGVARRVRTLIDYSRWQMPGLRHSFNTGSMAWWEEHLSRPRMTLARLVLAPSILGALAILLALFDPARWVWTTALIIGGLVAVAAPWVHLRVIGGFTHAREEGYGPDLPRWVARGWIVPVFALPVAAMFVPPSPLWATVLVVVAALTMQWTHAIATGRALADENPLSWLLTAGIYGFFGFAPFFGLRAEAMVALVTIAVLVVHTRVVAYDVLAAIGEPLTHRLKVPGIAAIAALGGIALFSPLPPPFVAGTCFALVALLLNAMFHGQVGWLRYATRVAIALAYLVAAAVSMPDQPNRTMSGEAATSVREDVPFAPRVPTLRLTAEELESDLLRSDPQLAKIENGNPKLFEIIRDILRQTAEGSITRADSRSRIDDAINAEHRLRRKDAPDALVAEGVRLQLAKRLVLGQRSAALCAKEVVPGFNTLYPDSLLDRQNVLVYDTVSSPPQRRRTGSPIAHGKVARRAAVTLGITVAQLEQRLDGKGGDYHVCQARIEYTRALTHESDADLAVTLRGP